MTTELYLLLVYCGIAAVGLCVAMWWLKENLLAAAKTSHERLLEEKAQMRGCVIDWRCSDGSFMPQHKRQKMFKNGQWLLCPMGKRPGRLPMQRSRPG